MTESVTGNTFIDNLLDQTPQNAFQPRRGQNYNYPLRAYLKPNGDVAWLQGDPVNRAYYQDKGFHMLSDLPGRNGSMSEVEQYRTVEYPKILKEQRDKAAIINAIRRAGERYRDLNLEDTFDDYSVDELRQYLADIKEETGKNIRVVLPRKAQAREEAQDRVLLTGVETSDTVSMEELQGKLERGHGYDPIDQARRRGGRGPGAA